jgi:hypothetical protein
MSISVNLIQYIYCSSSEVAVRIWWIWPRLEVMRTSVNLVQYIFQFRGCGHNLEDISKVGGHEDIFSSCSVFSSSEGCGHNLEDMTKVGGHEDVFSSCSIYFPVQRLWSQSRGYFQGWRS